MTNKSIGRYGNKNRSNYNSSHFKPCQWCYTTIDTYIVTLKVKRSIVEIVMDLVCMEQLMKFFRDIDFPLEVSTEFIIALNNIDDKEEEQA